jgi:curved DNA-binding protein CbpA
MSARWKRQEFAADYYGVLQVTPSASHEEIRRAFRRLVLESHPDKNPGRRQWSERRIRELIQAYEIVGNKEKREAFDQFRRAAGGAVESRNGESARRGGSQEPFFFRKRGPGARALLILHFLLHRRAAEAIELLEEMEAIHGDAFLSEHLESKDYLDSLFLLAEHFTQSKNYAAAARRLRAFYLHERTSRFPRHYLEEVVRQLKDLYLRKLPRVLEPSNLISYLVEAASLRMTAQEELLRLRRLAEAQALTGAFGAARATLAKIQARDPNAKGLQRIEELLSKGA